MPIYIKQSGAVTPNYVKVKGKLYKKTNNALSTFGTYITGKIEGFNVLENADFKNVRKQDSIVKLRPLYATTSTELFTPGTANINTYTFNIVVITKEVDHPFYGQGSSLCFAVSGIHGVPLNLIRGKKYVLKQTDASNTGQKIILTNDEQGIDVIDNIPDITYTGTAGVDGELTFIIPLTSQDAIYLSSEGGEYMAVKINVDQYVESTPTSINNYTILSSVDFFTRLSAV